MTRNTITVALLATGVLAACSQGVDTRADAAAASASPAAAAAPAVPDAALPAMTVYKSPTCGCCHQWVKHMEANGFTVKSVDQPDVTPVKREHGVTQELSSCHTALVGGYVIEGHVPAADVKRLLAERPAGVRGLAAPGMPNGSPGMEGLTKDRYDVIAFDSSGATRVFASH